MTKQPNNNQTGARTRDKESSSRSINVSLRALPIPELGAEANPGRWMALAQGST